MNAIDRRVLVAVSLLALVLTGCSSREDDSSEKDKQAAEKVARDYTVATEEHQCEMTHPDSDLSSARCDSAANANETPWPGHPTAISETEKWKGDGYAVVIPDQKGKKTVIGLKKSEGTWKVLNIGYISEEDQKHSDPACWALSDQDGADCHD